MSELKFKPGDKVILARNTTGSDLRDEYLGTVAEIKGVHFITVDDQPTYVIANNRYWWKEDDLDLVEEPKYFLFNKDTKSIVLPTLFTKEEALEHLRYVGLNGVEYSLLPVDSAISIKKKITTEYYID